MTLIFCQSNQVSKDYESIQSSTTPDPNHHMGNLKTHTRKHNKQERIEVSPFPAGNNKAAMNKQDGITKTNKKHKKQKRNKKKHKKHKKTKQVYKRRSFLNGQ